MTRRPTIKDVAVLAGVHHTTVSLALRNHRSIPETTRARIRAAAEKLHYRADPVLASLMSYRRGVQPQQRQPVVAWVTNFPLRAQWRRTRVFVEFYEAAAERAEQLGYRLEEFWLREGGMSAARVNQILRTRNITAVMLAPQPAAETELEDLGWRDMSAVTLGYSLVRPRLHLVSNHQFASMIQLMQCLQALGYRRIGLALPSGLDRRVHHGWLGGYLAEQHSLPAASRLAPWVFAEFSSSQLRTWLKRARPDVVISPTERVWNEMPRLGYRVPDDIGMAHPSVSALHDGRSGIDEISGAIGAAAMDLLSGLWQRNQRGIPEDPHRVLIEGHWVRGSTVRDLT